MGDFIYVSNVNGDPTAKDGNGYISKLYKSGEVCTNKFIEGLNAPKGMVIVNEVLYVTDIDKVLGFEVNSGKKTFEYDLVDKLSRRPCSSFRPRWMKQRTGWFTLLPAWLDKALERAKLINTTMRWVRHPRMFLLLIMNCARACSHRRLAVSSVRVRNRGQTRGDFRPLRLHQTRAFAFHPSHPPSRWAEWPSQRWCLVYLTRE